MSGKFKWQKFRKTSSAGDENVRLRGANETKRSAVQQLFNCLRLRRIALQSSDGSRRAL